MQNITTSDFSEFGINGIKEAHALLSAWLAQGLPDDFSAHRVTIIFNERSRYVFLANDVGDVAMMRDGELASFYSCPHCGAEGFAAEINWNKEEGLCGKCHQFQLEQ